MERVNCYVSTRQLQLPRQMGIIEGMGRAGCGPAEGWNWGWSLAGALWLTHSP